MGDNALSILLKGKLSDDIKELNQSIIELSKNPALQRLSLKVNIDDSEIQLLSNQIKQFQTQMSKSLNLNVNTSSGSSGLDKFTQKFKVIAGQSEKLKQDISEFTNESGQAVKVIDQIEQKINDVGKEINVVVESEKFVTDNFKKQRIEAEKLNAQLIKNRIDSGNSLANQKQREIDKAHIEALRMDAQYNQQSAQFLKNKIDVSNSLYNQKMKEIEAAHAEALTINSNIEKEKLRTLEIQKQIDLYKQRMLGGNGFAGELDIFASKQKGKYDKDALTKIRNDVEALNISTPDLNNKIKQTGVQFSSLKQQAAQSGSIMTRSLENAMKFLRFYLVGGTLVGIVNAFRNAVDVVVELDNSLNQIRIVTNKSQESVDQLAKSYNNLAKEMSVTTKEIADAAVEFYRQGLSDSEVEDRLRNTIQYSKISAMEFTEAAEILTATVNSMGVGAEHAADVMAYLGDATATGKRKCAW